jgi:hypothetical protein
MHEHGDDRHQDERKDRSSFHGCLLSVVARNADCVSAFEARLDFFHAVEVARAEQLRAIEKDEFRLGARSLSSRPWASRLASRATLKSNQEGHMRGDDPLRMPTEFMHGVREPD